MGEGNLKQGDITIPAVINDTHIDTSRLDFYSMEVDGAWLALVLDCHCGSRHWLGIMC